jgi:hypothetical protein
LIVDLDIRMQVVVFAKPLRINRIWEGCAGSIELCLGRRRERQQEQREQRGKFSQFEVSPGTFFDH